MKEKDPRQQTQAHTHTHYVDEIKRDIVCKRKK